MTVDIYETHAVLRHLVELPIPLRDRLTDHLYATCGPIVHWRLEDLDQASATVSVALQLGIPVGQEGKTLTLNLEKTPCSKPLGAVALKVLQLASATALTAAALTGCVIKETTPTSTSLPAATAPAASSTPAVTAPVPLAPAPTPAAVVKTSGVTLANYNRLEKGMSYAQVVEILGEPGTELSRSFIANITTVMYQWMGEGSLGANMNAMFQDDKLVSKAQFGLR